MPSFYTITLDYYTTTTSPVIPCGICLENANSLKYWPHKHIMKTEGSQENKNEKLWVWSQTKVLPSYPLLGCNLHSCSLYGKVCFNYDMCKKPVKVELGEVQLAGLLWPIACFCMACEWRMVLTLLNGRGKIKRRVFRDIWEVCKIHISVSVNSLIGTRAYSSIYGLPMATFAL